MLFMQGNSFCNVDENLDLCFAIRLKGVQNCRNTYSCRSKIWYDMFVKMHLHVSDQFDLMSAVDLILLVKNRHI